MSDKTQGISLLCAGASICSSNVRQTIPVLLLPINPAFNKFRFRRTQHSMLTINTILPLMMRISAHKFPDLLRRIRLECLQKRQKLLLSASIWVLQDGITCAGRQELELMITEKKDAAIIICGSVDRFHEILQLI